jgi:hypothetical protein
MSGHHGLQAFVDILAVENERLFIVYRGKRCWFDWRLAHEFAFFTSLLTRRKESVHGVYVAGRWYWHVRVAPATLTDGGAGAPPATTGAVPPVRHPAGAAPGTPAPSSPPVLLCDEPRGRWICASPRHRDQPDRHFFVHAKAAAS